MRCTECQKRFANPEFAQLHASKTGHTDFEESEKTTLTDEERKARLADLQERLKEARAKKEHEQQERDKQAELLRRKAGKDLTEIKEKMLEQEVKKSLDEQKKAKLEDKAARARILAQIEEDRRIKRERDAVARQAAAGNVIANDTVQVQSTAMLDAQPTRLTNETRLQIRVPGGVPPIRLTLPSNTLITDLYKQVAERTGNKVSKLSLSSSFPYRVFNEHQGSTLADLGLCPSATLDLQIAK